MPFLLFFVLVSYTKSCYNGAHLFGEVSERSKEHAWKVCVRENVPRVRIPLSPPSIHFKPLSEKSVRRAKVFAKSGFISGMTLNNRIKKKMSYKRGTAFSSIRT